MVLHFPDFFGALCDPRVPREACDDRLANCAICLSRRALILEQARQRAVVRVKEWIVVLLLMLAPAAWANAPARDVAEPAWHSGATVVNYVLRSEEFDSPVWQRVEGGLCQWVHLPRGTFSWSIYATSDVQLLARTRSGWWLSWLLPRGVTRAPFMWRRYAIEFWLSQSDEVEVCVFAGAGALFGAQVVAGASPYYRTLGAPVVAVPEEQ